MDKRAIGNRYGVLWIGTGDDGLLRHWKGEVTKLTKANGLAHNGVTALLEDREGSLWVGTQDGLTQTSDEHHLWE
ncbi:MAG TPA: two-component regulator propeller domain-containing protein [Clostridia bacterium]|nr:two-component regulator propeller domain-containing protein [Clostridia bacterium]